MSKITREELEAQLQTAINQRARQYDRVVGFAFHFANDDTGSKQDVDHFRHILKMLGGSEPDVHVVQGVKKSQRKLENSFRKKIDDLLDLDGRSLLLVHYAGHGTVVNGELMFTAGGHRSKAISWPELVRNTTSRKSIEDNDPLDVLFIIDSCYSSTATRKPKDATERVVEVVAAVNSSGTALENDPSNPRTQTRTFTSKLADYIALLKGQNVDSIDFSVAIAKLVEESPLKKPTHKILKSAESIKVNLGARPFPQGVPDTDNELRAIVRVHLTPTLMCDDASALKHWLSALDGR